MKEIQEFFHKIAPEILALVKEGRHNTSIVNQKDTRPDSVNFATETDLAVEHYIIEAIKKYFPDDLIVSEEENESTQLDQPGNLWIIDPICGTANFSRGLPLFVTNIALARDGQLIAACVVDHLFGRYIWSVGDGVYENDQPADTSKKSPGTIVDVDLSALNSAGQEIKASYIHFISRMIMEERIMCTSLGSSSAFLYAALGIYDAFITSACHIWDLAASIFLIQQGGGTVTQFNGQPWTIKSGNVIAAHDPELHRRLRQLFT